VLQWSVKPTMSGITRDGLDDAERLKELGHLAAAVGHQVINAFSAMVSNAELIRSHASDPDCDLAEVAALGAAIIENALSASHVPRRLIDLTRRVTSPGFDQLGDPPALIDLNQLIRDTVESQSLESGTAVAWSLDLNPIPMIRGNAPQLRSLFGYLIQNARESMPKGAGTITFLTNVDERNWVVVEIRDTGGGMSPDVLKRATEPFFTTKHGRTGTGLTVAHGIWRRHRGALSIESHPGEGTMIRLAVEAPAAAEPSQAATARPAEQSRPVGRTRAGSRNPEGRDQAQATAEPSSTSGDTP
jgi:two-component system, NtrC family, sensor kinase